MLKLAGYFDSFCHFKKALHCILFLLNLGIVIHSLSRKWVALTGDPGREGLGLVVLGVATTRLHI